MAHGLLTKRSVPVRAVNDDVPSARFESGEQPVHSHEPGRSESAEFDLQHSLVKELLERLKSKPELADLFQEGCLALARAQEAGRLPRGHADRAIACSELLTIQRRLIEALPFRR